MTKPEGLTTPDPPDPRPVIALIARWRALFTGRVIAALSSAEMACLTVARDCLVAAHNTSDEGMKTSAANWNTIANDLGELQRDAEALYRASALDQLDAILPPQQSAQEEEISSARGPLDAGVEGRDLPRDNNEVSPSLPRGSE